jgi:large subunit ribosomal protein L25
MGTVQVRAELREVGNKGHARRLRMAGKIPAIVYGEKEDNIPIALDGPSFEHMLRRISSGNQILDLLVTGRAGTETKVLIKEVQRNPIDQRVLHVDLQHISMTHKVRVRVPIRVTGMAIGVKEGGILEHLEREVEIECLPSEILPEVVLDVSALIRGESLHVRDLPIPSHIHVHESPERVVVTVAGKIKEEEPAAAPAAEAATPEGGATPAAEPTKEKGSKEKSSKEK